MILGAEPRGYGGRRAIVLSMGREDEVFQAKWNKRLRTWIPSCGMRRSGRTVRAHRLCALVLPLLRNSEVGR